MTWHNTAVNMIGPALVLHGSALQRARLLSGIAKADISFALGYSEPDHGSDLAGLRTTATRSDDGWSIRGQKVYTSHAGFATHLWLAARTGTTEQRQRGISIFVVPMEAPGITLQPMHGLNGHRANIVFLDDVRVDGDALIGAVDGGWTVITDALAFERVSLGAIAARIRGYFDRLLAHVASTARGGRRLADDPLTRDTLARLAAEIEAARLLAADTTSVIAGGQVPLHQAAMSKTYASELMERFAEAALDMLGTGAALADGAEGTLVDGRFEYAVRDALLFTIGGGTNEIQRTMIAQRGLGLPR